MKQKIEQQPLKRTDYIFHKTHESFGGGEGTEVMIVIDIDKGTTKVKVEHRISEYFDIKDYDQAVHLYKSLTGGNGRRMYKPSDLAHFYDKDKYKK